MQARENVMQPFEVGGWIDLNVNFCSVAFTKGTNVEQWSEEELAVLACDKTFKPK